MCWQPPTAAVHSLCSDFKTINYIGRGENVNSRRRSRDVFFPFRRRPRDYTSYQLPVWMSLASCFPSPSHIPSIVSVSRLHFYRRRVFSSALSCRSYLTIIILIKRRLWNFDKNKSRQIKTTHKKDMSKGALNLLHVRFDVLCRMTNAIAFTVTGAYGRGTGTRYEVPRSHCVR